MLTAAQKKDREIDSLSRLIPSLTGTNRYYTETSLLILRYYSLGKQQEAKNLLSKYLAEAKTENSLYGFGALYNTKSTILYYESKFDSSLYFLKKALLIRKEIHDTIGTLKILSNLGGIEYMLNNYKKSLEYYEEGLKMENDLHFDEGKYISLNNLGAIHNTLKLNDKAYLYYRKAEKFNIKEKADEDLVNTYDGLARVFKDKKDLDSALYFAQKGSELAAKINNPLYLAY